MTTIDIMTSLITIDHADFNHFQPTTKSHGSHTQRTDNWIKTDRITRQCRKRYEKIENIDVQS